MKGIEVHHTYVQRQHNETHQTLKRWGGEEEKWEYNGGGELVQSTLYGITTMKPSHIINIY
jgi:hypothetical protein